VPDMVENAVNGFLVEPGKAEPLAQALCTLLDSPQLCQQFGRRSYDKAVERYTWDGTGQRIRKRILQEIQ
jgi:YD repeat-containing protein